MPELNLFFFTITEADFARIVSIIQQWTKRPTNIFKDTNPEMITLALTNSIEYLLADRITDGIGKGGWGHSDKEYMSCLYGSEVADQVHESVMTTVIVTHALHECLMRLESTGTRFNNLSPRDLLDSIVDDLDTYLQNRWDALKGHGGVLIAGREGDFILTPRYRHTAWLFHLWNLLPRYRERMQTTATNLLEEFDKVKWREEKVATAVAAHSAFSILEKDPLCKALGTTVPDRVKHLKNVLEAQIESQFSRDISGWTSGNALQGGRQMYTQFVCAEMANMHSFPETRLAVQMCAALESTMCSKWCSADGRGIPLTINGQTDISASALIASALIRKPQLSDREKIFLSNVITFLIAHCANEE